MSAKRTGGMDIDFIVSLDMILMMLIQTYLNLASLVMPKKYPEQWKKRLIKMPIALFDVCGVLGSSAALIKLSAVNVISA